MAMLPRSWIDALFQRFEGLYGNTFHNKWAGLDIENIKLSWAEVLGDLTGEQIKAGLQECAKSAQFPPSAPEFYQLCKQQKVLPIHRQFQIEKQREPVSEENLRRLAEIKQQLAAKLTVEE